MNLYLTACIVEVIHHHHNNNNNSSYSSTLSQTHCDMTLLDQLDMAFHSPSKSGTKVHGSTPFPKTEIFSPRPETPGTPPSFPFLSTPSPELKRSKTTAAPPTPPRRPRIRARQGSSSVTATRRSLNSTSNNHNNSFGSTLAAFPTPPSRAPSLSLPPASTSSFEHHNSRPRPRTPGSGNGSSPLARSYEGYPPRRRDEEKKEEQSEEMVFDETDEDSDGRTVTGIPATPSTASSGWDTFWSEVSIVPPS